MGLIVNKVGRALLMIMLVASVRGLAEAEVFSLASVIRAKLTEPASDLDERVLPHFADLQSLYGKRDFQPIWLSEGKLKATGERFLERLQNVAREGLHPQWYDVAKLTDLSRTLATDEERVELELLLTHSLFTYASDLVRGRVNPNTVLTRWAVPLDKTPVILAVTEMVQNDDIEKGLDALGVADPEYAKLTLALKDVREALAKKGEYPVIPVGKKMERGDRGQRVRALARRLAAEEGSGVDESSDAFDEKLEKAVASFQKKRGLTPDGKIGAKTLAALNQSRQSQIRQILVNLERLRWRPKIEADTYVSVDIANFELSVHEADRPTKPLKMRVIVGGEDWKTPIFSDAIRYLVVNPTWTPPDSIATKDLAAKLARNPNFLKRHNFQVVSKEGGEVVDPEKIRWADYVVPKDAKKMIRFPYVLKQPSGKANPLGSIKFAFPNPFAVYLHGTTSSRLFEKDVRTFSHGCIRVEKPFALAMRLLSRNKVAWDEKRLKKVIAKGKEATIPLDRPIPIHLFYRTAWVDDSGTLNLRQDVYGWDPPTHQALVDSGKPVRKTLQANNLAE